MKRKHTCCIAAALLFAGTSTALAAPFDDDYDDDDDRSDIERPSRIGVGVTVGGGVIGFTDSQLRDVSEDAGGSWEVRVAAGTHLPVALEAAYIGTSTNLDIGGVDNGMLVGTIVEGAVRLNLLPTQRWNPYLFVGAGWQRFDTRDTALTPARSGIAEQDDVAVFPMGLGLTYRDPTGVTGELRGTFRPAADSSLIDDLMDDSDAELHTWQAAANVGYEF